MSGDARRENDDVLGVESPLALNDILAPAHAATPNQPRSPTNKYEDQQDGGEVDKDDPLSNASQLEELARSLRTPGDANAPIIKSGNKKEGRITMTTQRRQTMPHTQQTEQNYAPVPQKSELTSLCERFLHHYCHLNADGSPSTLVLTDVATSLGVSRRRIYDIINVLEAIDVIKRTDKLTYQFCGYFHFPVLFESLAAAARETATSSVHSPLRPTKKAGTGKPSVYSLSALTRRLVSLLVVGGPSPIKVSEAAVELVAMGGGGSGVGGGESVDAGHNNPNNPNNNNSSTSDDTKSGGRSQTQITVERRLYDIGSILGSVGLVEKIYIGKRKPAFQWVYGWRPGDEHTPPELAVAKAAKEPAPPLPPPPPPQPQPQPTEVENVDGGGGGSIKRQKTATDIGVTSTKLDSHSGSGSMNVALSAMPFPYALAMPPMMPTPTHRPQQQHQQQEEEAAALAQQQMHQMAAMTVAMQQQQHQQQQQFAAMQFLNAVNPMMGMTAMATGMQPLPPGMIPLNSAGTDSSGGDPTAAEEVQQQYMMMMMMMNAMNASMAASNAYAPTEASLQQPFFPMPISGPQDQQYAKDPGSGGGGCGGGLDGETKER